MGRARRRQRRDLGKYASRLALHAWAEESFEGSRNTYFKVVALLVTAGATVRPEWLADQRIRGDDRMLAALNGEPLHS
jgi:hypothetical protein